MRAKPSTPLLLLTLTLTAPGQDGDKKDRAGAEAEAAAMAEYMKLIAPGPEHEELAKQAGEWDIVQTFFMPGAPPQKSKGVMVNKMTLGGRYLISEAKMNSFLGPYNGIGTSAYDKVNKRFVHTWIDSFGTGIMVSHGKLRDDGAIEYISEPQLDTMSGARVVFRMVTKMDGANKMSFEMYSKPVGGEKETKTMTIAYTRKK